jgi:mono/diheme cytochrome c family protein
LPPGVTPPMVQRGDALFHGDGRCAKCHGSDAKGTQKGPGLAAPKKWININGEYDQIVDVVTKGVPEPKEHSAPMPAKGKAQLSDDDVRAVSAYVWSISR